MLRLRVRSITYEAEGILSFDLVDPEGKDLPAFDAGAHVDVQIPGGLTRRYSLCDSPRMRDHYRIGVLNDPKSRGGSRAMHERVRPGDLIDVSGPHNFFPLAPDTRHALLLAGGIGITPLMAMIEHMRETGQSYELHYCTRTPEVTPFTKRLTPEVAAGRAHLHHDGGDPRKGLDITGLLRSPSQGTHVYYCGPTGFMKAVQEATDHWASDSVHFEYFGVDPTVLSTAVDARTGEVVLERSGRTIQVQPSQTILQAVRDAGIPCESSCESGLCGTCKVRYTGGHPQHNDFVLSEEERQEFVLICCAGIAEGPLVLDI